MEFTQQEVLEMLEKSGRMNWNLRQMSALRKEGFLPPLKRETKSGTNKPLYVWDETELKQIVDVYDWWDYCDGDRGTLTLLLWLDDYEIPPDFLSHVYLPLIKTYHQKLTRGKTDPDDILDEVSEIVVIWMRKLKYTPGLVDQRKKMETEQNFSMEQMEKLTETVLSALAVPDQKLADETFYPSLLDASESQDTSTDLAEDEDFLTQSQDISASLRDIFTLPHLLEAIRTATPEQWQQARKDYLCFCHILSVIEERRQKNEEESLPEEFLMRLKITGAVWLTVPLLSTRYHGYGQWLDMAFEQIHELLADPAIQEEMLKKHMARRANKAVIQDKET